MYTDVLVWWRMPHMALVCPYTVCTHMRMHTTDMVKPWIRRYGVCVWIPQYHEIGQFPDFGILDQIQNLTKSMDFMISAHLGTILDPILARYGHLLWRYWYRVWMDPVLMHVWQAQ